MNYYTADLHFGHKGVIALDHRPFETVEVMDEAMISLSNQRVNRDGCMLYGYRPVRLNEIVKANRTM